MLRYLKTYWPWLLVLLGYAAIGILFFVTVEALILHISLFLLSFFAIQFSTICLHELGHLFACLAFGELPAALVIGTGPLLVRFQVGPLTFRLNSTTNSGMVISKYHFETFQLPNFRVLYASGPLMDLLALAAVVFCLTSTPEWLSENPHYEDQMKPLFVITACYLFYFHLAYLLKKSSFTAGAYSDAGGLTTIQVIMAAPEPIRRAYIAISNTYDVIDERFVDPLPDTFFAEMETYYRWAVVQPNIPQEYVRAIKDSFITTVLLHRFKPLLPLADTFSLELLQSLPNSNSYKGSRGSVLVDCGELHTGRALLQDVFSQSKVPYVRAIAAAFIAIAEHRLANLAGAEEWLRKAEEIPSVSQGVGFQAINRARAELLEHIGVAQ
jgi:hypothetical protein